MASETAEEMATTDEPPPAVDVEPVSDDAEISPEGRRARNTQA